MGRGWASWVAAAPRGRPADPDPVGEGARRLQRQEQKRHPAAAGGASSSSSTRRQAMDLRGDEEVASCLERRRRTPAWGGYFLSRPPAPLVSVFPTAVVPRSCAVWEGPVPCSVLSSVRTLESGPLSSTLSSPPPPPAISRDAQTVSRGRP